ncbi:MAG: carbon-nitrogen family hydrolase [Desulfobacterales bacterium]|nr:carbon-nitrogen family hydrolase [Desulfobacterales bacterium]
MKVTSIQLERREISKAEATAHALALVDQASASDLILLPEMWPSGFFCFDRYPVDAEPIDGPTVQAFRDKAAAIRRHILMGSFVERNADGLFNTSLLIDAHGSVIAVYRKIHLFGYQSSERDLLTRGTAVVVADTPWGKAGLATCYDLRFPEQFRKMVDLGAEFFLVVSAWPAVRLEPWVLFNRVRALENLAFLISCNCAGADAGSLYAGHSMVVDPLGKILARGGDQECMVSADIDMDQAAAVRKEFSALHDRVDLG